ncbi:30S ribosomal protein S15 [bacterium]|nr:30S ribosomal protein S15 [bacterium]
MADFPEKSAIIKEYGISERDTGSSEVQAALLTHRINHLTGHLKDHKKDNHSRRGLILLVSRRRHLLNYISRKNYSKYQDLVKKLGLRK